MRDGWPNAGGRRALESKRIPLLRGLGAALLLAILVLWLGRPIAMAGFGEAGDFALAWSARLLGELGLERLELAGMLGGAELNYALGQMPPVTLAMHALLFHLFGELPVTQLFLLLALHLLISLVAMAVARQWTGRNWAVLVAGLVFALHPVAFGTSSGLVGLSALLAALFILIAMSLTIAFARGGGPMLLILLTLAAMLAVFCGAAGVMVFPASLLVALTDPQRRGKPRSRRVLLAPLTAMLGVVLPLIYIARTFGRTMYLLKMTSLHWADVTEQMSLSEKLLKVGAALIGKTAYLLRALLAPVDPTMTTPREWVGTLLIASLAAALFTLAIYRALRRPGNLWWPLLGLLAMLPLAADLVLPRALAPASVFAAAYAPLIFFALWLAELTPRGEGNAGRIVFIMLILLALLPQSWLLGLSRGRHSELVNRLGREFVAQIDEAPAGADVIVPARPTRMNLLEAAFLAGQYRQPPKRQIRFRLLVGGRLFAGPKATRLGREFGALVRLPYGPQNLVIGLSGDELHLIDLTPQIKQKILLAEDAIAQTGASPPPWQLVDEDIIDRWPVVATEVPEQPVGLNDTAWFVEGFLYRLHPHLGRVGY